MNDRPISFRVCDFSEQISDMPYPDHYKQYSAVMHVDGEVFQWRKALQGDFLPPLASLRTEAWIRLLEMVAERKSNQLYLKKSA